jgi:tetratricopeptide (TPR) repeat protein
MKSYLLILFISLFATALGQEDALNSKKQLQELMTVIETTRTSDRMGTIATCLEAEKIAKELKDENTLDQIYYTLGTLYTWVNQELAISYCKKGIQLSQKNKNEIQSARFYLVLGKVADSKELFEQAIKYYNHADSLYTITEDRQKMGWAKANLGHAYYEIQQYYKAIELLNESIKLEDKKDPNPITLINLGNCYSEIGAPDKALGLYLQAYDISYNIENIYGQAASNLTLAQFHHKYDRYSKAIAFALEAVAISEGSKNYYTLRTAYNQLHESYKAIGDFQASLKNLERYQVISDSLNTRKNDAWITNIENSFALQKQALELKLLKKEESRLSYKEKAQSSRNRLLIILLISSGVVLIALVILYFSKQKASKIKQKLNTETATSRNRELTNLALYIQQRSMFIDVIRNDLKIIRDSKNQGKKDELTSDLFIKVGQYGGVDNGADRLKKSIEESSQDFTQRLKIKFPGLTEYEQRLAQLLRMKLSSKEIAVLLDITPHSVNISRYRLRKKINLERDESLFQCFANI